ncbi:type VII secretion-associated serine protease mycosin [Phytohabitans kaempferiae]|uniref:Type VII secretion-associated serine protease mycosin n=1 Tax=Phytohabitans kaempferiae TaxID=1620943 RepID=A0ABV6M0U0_9ACTN
MAQAHAYSLGDRVIVAVIDTGVDPHPDLLHNLLPGTDLATTSGNGQHDTDSHGTGMAGLIAAHGTGPSAGALGIAPQAKILPIREPSSSQGADSDVLARGITWALHNNAAVLNISSAGGSSPALRDAIKSALDRDVVVVAPAGNRPFDLGVTFPAAYDGVLAVGATDRNGDHAEVSVTGEQVAISAPGVDIYSTSYNGQYRKGTGTSDAAAIVSGAVALVRSKYPQLSAPEVVHRLTATATDKGAPGRDEQYGYGVLNLVAALTADVPPLGEPTAAPTTTGAAAVPEQSDDHADGGLLGAVLAALGAAAVLAIGLAYWHRRRQKTSRPPPISR